MSEFLLQTTGGKYFFPQLDLFFQAGSWFVYNAGRIVECQEENKYLCVCFLLQEQQSKETHPLQGSKQRIEMRGMRNYKIWEILTFFSHSI